MGTLGGMAALVTGGGSGIGLACAQRLADDGATVTICGRTASRLDEAVASIRDGRSIVADISDDESVAAAIAYAAEPAGKLDIVVANAGGGPAIGPPARAPTSAGAPTRSARWR